MSEPVAIVGLGCRLPGSATNPANLWRLLLDGVDAVTEVGPDRFNVRELWHPRRDEAGRSYTFAAGVLEDLWRFDAGFFGISPREAEQMDPQQRLLLELTQEALESGGFPAAPLEGEAIAVYLGSSSADYGALRSFDLQGLDPYFMTGNTLSVAANRISHAFNWRGPSLAVDTACSSSLVALHEAHRVVATGEVPMAVAAGANILLSPVPFVGFSRASMLAPDGRCRPFDAEGRGYVRAEGGVVVLLKALARARRDGDRILGVIRGVGVNSDGTTQGIALPNGEAQEALLRTTYEAAGVDPSELGYLEAHGTGTPVGDPIEAKAIARALARARPAANPLLLGSAKSNLGHLEPASGLVGVAKALLILRHGIIPPSIHFREPNPNIDFRRWGLEVVRHTRSLPIPGEAPLIGVNSFGFGGVNAHVILEGERAGGRGSFRSPPTPIRSNGTPLAPTPVGENGAGPASFPAGENGTVPAGSAEGEHPSPSPAPLPPLFASARSDAALRRRAGQLADHLDGEHPARYRDAAWTAAFRHDWHPHRLLVRGAGTLDEVVIRLREFAQRGPGSDLDADDGRADANNGGGDPASNPADLAEASATRLPSTVHHALVPGTGAVGWIFTGNGSQWPGMMRAWLNGVPGAREALDRVDQVLSPRLGWSTVEYLERPAAEQAMARTEVAQPLLFALQVAMVELLRGAGAQPGLVLGHSVGEVAAAWACGGLSLDDACRVIVARSEVAARTAGLGGMAAAGVTAERARHWIEAEGLGAQVEVAGYNSADSVTLTGDRAALHRLGDRARSEEAFYRILELDYPFHSAAMDPLEAPLRAALEGVDGRSGSLPFISTVAGAALDPELLISDYWWHNLRRPVRFAEAMDAVFEMGVTRFLEIGPRGILGHYVTECADEAGLVTEYRATARKGRPEVAVWHEALDSAVLAMGPSLLAGEFPEPGRLVELPTYPWAETRYRVEPTAEAAPRVFSAPEHPLLGTRVEAAPATWECSMDPDLIPWLGDHRVAGSVVFPAAGFLEMALAAAHRVRDPEDGARPSVERLEIRRPLTFQAGQSRVVRTRVTDLLDGVRVESRLRGSAGGWTEHAVATLRPAYLPPEPLPAAPDATEPLSAEHLYREAEGRGLVYGERFQVITAGVRWRDGAEARLGEGDDDAAMDGMHLAPTLVDGALQLLLAAMTLRLEELRGDWAYLPVVIGRCHLAADGGRPTRARMRLKGVGARSVTADFDLLDREGRVVAGLRACRFLQVPRPGVREWHESLLRRKEIRVSGAPTLPGGAAAPPLQRRVALLAPPDSEAVGPWTVRGAPEELELVVSHPDPDHLARLRAELPALPNLRLQPWDEPLPCDEIHLLGPGSPEQTGVEPEEMERRWGPRDRGAPVTHGSHVWMVPAGSRSPEGSTGVEESGGGRDTGTSGGTTGEDPWAEALANDLLRRGARVERAGPPKAEPPAGGEGGGDGVEPIGAPGVWALTEGLGGSCSGLELTQAVLTAARRLHRRRNLHRTHLLVLIPDVERAPEMAAVPALLRVLTNEFEGVSFRSIQLPVDAGAPLGDDLRSSLMSRVVDAWLQHPDEMELRLLPSPESGVAAIRIHRTPDLPPDETAQLRLTIPVPGLLDRLRWEEVPARSLRPGEVRIRVHATGLNFRDVMWALGLIPDELVEDGFAGPTLGMECAGEVTEVGPGVEGLSPGARVLAFAPSAFAREVVTKASTVAPLPDHVYYREAATLPIPFFTAYFALNTLARLRAGERVLIHGGAGGVGLAAIQWARHVGAEIFATAGTDEKRALLREAGVHHVLHSRDLSFADQVRRLTGGEGVDVALNSLAGEAMQATLDLLRPFGRFLELGKRDFALNSPLAMRALRNNITYHGIDADQLLAHRPREAEAVFREVLDFFRQGVLVPLPQRVYEADRVEEAFRAMQNARHVGKVVVTMDPPPRRVAPRPRPFRCRPDGSYLVLGGTGGFGLATARWLAESGARFLVLASRRGSVGPDGRAALEGLRARGVRVEVLTLDATDSRAVEGLPGELNRLGLPPLRGVVHAAMVLADGAAAEMEDEAVARVWHPKVTAARNLDRITGSMELDWMVYYSSATTLFGNPGQANYVAANAALEALAEARSREGRSTLAVAWGPIGDAGVLARSPETRELLTRRLGREPLGAEEGLQALGELLARGITGVRFILPMAWKRLRRALPVAGDAAYLWLDGASARETEERLGGDFREMVGSLDPRELRSLLVEIMVEQVAGVLRLPEAAVDPDRPLDELGMDSLMAVELSVAVERQVGVELPLLSMAGGVTLRQVTERVLERIRGGAAAGTGDGAGAGRVVAGVRVDEADSVLGRHGIDLSPEEVSQVADELEARLREAGGTQ